MMELLFVATSDPYPLTRMLRYILYSFAALCTVMAAVIILANVVGRKK